MEIDLLTSKFHHNISLRNIINSTVGQQLMPIKISMMQFI